MVMVPPVTGGSLGCGSTSGLAWLLQRASVPTFPAGQMGTLKKEMKERMPIGRPVFYHPLVVIAS